MVINRFEQALNMVFNIGLLRAQGTRDAPCLGVFQIDAVGEIGVVFETRKNEATKTRKRGSQPSLLPAS